MIESGYYPPGAEFDPNAPYNQSDVPEKEFDVTCTLCMSKTVSAYTNDYVPGAEGVDYESDDEGGCVACGWHDPDDTSSTNWSEVFGGNHKTIPELLEELKKYIQRDLDNIDEVAEEQKHDKAFLKRKLEFLLEECDGWNVDEEDYEGE